MRRCWPRRSERDFSHEKWGGVALIPRGTGDVRPIENLFRGGDVAALRAEVELLRKAALSRTDAIMGGGASAFLNDSPMIGAAREQERHCTGWVYSAIRPIAQRIASQPVPVRVGRKTGRPRGAKDARDGIRVIPDHPIIQAIEHPNEVMTGWSLLWNTVVSLELTGRAFWWLIGDKDSHQIFPLPSSWVEPHHERGLFSSYMIRPRFAGAAMQVELDGSEVCRFYYPDPQNPVRGSLGPLQAAALAVNTDEAIQLAQQQAFQNGIFPGMAVIVGRDPDIHPDDGKADDRALLRREQRSNLINSILQMYRGSWRYGYPLILDVLIRDVKKISSSPAEMDFQNSSQLTKARIYQAFGVNPIICGEIENANRAQAAVADETFCSCTVNPKIELLSQWMTK